MSQKSNIDIEKLICGKFNNNTTSLDDYLAIEFALGKFISSILTVHFSPR
jgi:hypothetical protein